MFAGTASAQDFDFEFGNTGGGGGEGELAANASGIAVDADGNPWVADTDNHRIVKYDYNGKFIAAFTAPLGGGPAFTQPEAIAADASGFLYIVQGGADNQIVKIDTGGTFVRTIGPSGWKGAAMIDPSAIWVDSATGKLYVAEASQITIFDANGVATGAIPISGPTGVTFANGDVYVAYAGFSGNEVARLSGETTAIKGSLTYTGTVAELSSDASGRIYVSGGGNGRINRYTADLAFIDNAGSTQGLDEGDTNIPEASAIDCRGNVYVIDDGQRTADSNPASKALKFTQPGSSPPPCAERPPPPGGLDLQINDIDVFQAVQPERTYTAGPAPPTVPLFDIPELHAREARVRRGRGVAPRGSPDRGSRLRGRANRGARGHRQHPDDALGNNRRRAHARTDSARGQAGRADGRRSHRRDRPAHRSRPGAYSFKLPDDWTQPGTITLTARLNPAGIGCDGSVH